MPETIHMRCLCGAVRCEITPPTKGAAHCHCAYCRRAHGAAFVTWVIVPAEQFRIAAGRELLRWYDSSEQSRRAFCCTCGSSMLFESKLCPGEVHVARALIDGEVDQEPAFHCFVESRVSWARLDDDLTELSADSPVLAHYKKVRPAE